jgi:hypothetical protein
LFLITDSQSGTTQLILPKSISGMLDRSRFVLCMFMFAIFAFNPFGAMVDGFNYIAWGSNYQSIHTPGGRNILEHVDLATNTG